MSLRDQISTDIKNILEDTETGFGWEITITDPDGVTGDLEGFSNDIAQMIDPDTGLAVSGRTASVAVHFASLSAVGLELPVAIADESKKPWIVEFNDIIGNSYTFKVSESNPDRAAGVVVCLLECYDNT
jgi:hypothetical protein